MDSMPVYEMTTEAIALSAFALLSFLVCIPPLIWHCRNGNFPAACLIVWFLIQNFFNFVNPLIWPSDDFDSWWMGYGYCDIQAKLITGAGVGIAGPLVCIFRSLASVLDTDRATIVPTKGERRRNLAFEITFCVIIPILIMIIHYIVQERRYYIYGIVGCMPSYYSSWVSAVAGWMWPPLILSIAVYYCVIVVYRLIQNKRQFSYIVSMSSSTNKSRFVRLLSLSLVMLLGSLPAQIYVLYFNLTAFRPWLPYSWEVVHGSNWGMIEKVPMFGKVFFDRWIHVIAGFFLFVFFGFGNDAMLMYRSALLKLGFGRFFPGLEHPHIMEQRQGSTSTRFGSFSSRARMVFRKKSFSEMESISTRPEKSGSLSVDNMTFSDFGSNRPSSLDKPLPPVPPIKLSRPSMSEVSTLPIAIPGASTTASIAPVVPQRQSKNDSVDLEFLTDCPNPRSISLTSQENKNGEQMV